MASKFEYDYFYDEWNNQYVCAVNSQKYTYEEAYEIACGELDATDLRKYDAYVYYGFGWRDGEKLHGWWLCEYATKRCCPVWAFIAN